jgi:hypothetical protein
VCSLIRLRETLHKPDHDVTASLGRSLLERKTILNRLGRGLLHEDVQSRRETVDRDSGLDSRMHRHDHTIKFLLRQKLSVIGVDTRNAEVTCTATSSLLVNVTARHEITDRPALGKVADRRAEDLRWVVHREPEARVEVLHSVASTADDRDAREVIHAR